MLKVIIDQGDSELFKTSLDKNVDENELFTFCDMIKKIYNFKPCDNDAYTVYFFVDEVPVDYCLVPTFSRALKIATNLVEDDENKDVKLFENHKDRYYTQEEYKKMYSATLTIHKRSYVSYTPMAVYDSTFLITNYPTFKESVMNYVNYCNDKTHKYSVKIVVEGTGEVFEFAHDDLKVLMKIVERMETDF